MTMMFGWSVFAASIQVNPKILNTASWILEKFIILVINVLIFIDSGEFCIVGEALRRDCSVVYKLIKA